MAASRRDSCMHERRLRVVAARQSRPNEAAGPIVENFGARFVGERAAGLRAARGRRRYAPNIGAAPSTLRRKRRYVADRAPERPRRRFVKARERAKRGEQISQ